MNDKKKKTIRREIRQKMIGYITAALGLVAGLAWNDFIATLINNFFPLGKDTILAKLIYAVAISLIIVLATYYLLKLTEEEAEGK